MKRIIHIAPSMAVKGGISSVLKMYFKANLPSKYDLRFIATHEDGTKFHKTLIAVTGICRLIYMLSSKRIDVVHIHCGDIPSPYRKYILFEISRLFKLRVVLHLHGALFLEQYKRASFFWKKRLQTFFESSDTVICLSQSWSDAIGLLFPRSNRVVIHNGILLPERTEIDRRNSSGPTRMVFLGLIGKRKGLFDLLIAFDRLVKEGYDIQLSIGGNGEVAKLMERISSPVLKDRVHYLGWIDETQKDSLLSCSDMFVLPTHGEGMPISILEAMAYRLPVISTQVGGIPDLVEDDVTGYLIHPGDLDELYIKLKTLVENPDLRKQMGRNGRRKVEDAFDMKLNYRAITCIYDNLLQTPVTTKR